MIDSVSEGVVWASAANVPKCYSHMICMGHDMTTDSWQRCHDAPECLWPYFSPDQGYWTDNWCVHVCRFILGAKTLANTLNEKLDYYLCIHKNILTIYLRNQITIKLLFSNADIRYILAAKRKTMVIPLLMHWRYPSLELSHQNIYVFVHVFETNKMTQYPPCDSKMSLSECLSVLLVRQFHWNLFPGVQLTISQH